MTLLDDEEKRNKLERLELTVDKIRSDMAASVYSLMKIAGLWKENR